MCGIAGVYSINSALTPSADLVSKMTQAISHRGPDGEGIWKGKGDKIILGHRRLSIIDLSVDANQPMLSADSRFTIVFNGEIYNYKELREALKKEGIVFRTNSDTEVLLQLFARYGKDCLEMLDGMFAFGIWDAVEEKLFCARDRFGEKPFFYYYEDGLFVFASEVKSILAYLGKVCFNKDVLQNYLTGNYKFDDIQTPFKGLQSLSPSSCLSINVSGLNEEKYWSIDLTKKLTLENDAAYFARFHELFMESVRYRLRSDVPVGSSLSGGLDSSTVVGAMAGLDKAAWHTFSARFNSKKDEGKWIGDVVSKWNILNHEIWPGEDGLIRELEKITWHHEYPLGSGSVYAQWCVMSMPGKYGVKVLLDGQGADEYLCGYDELKYYAIWDLFHNGAIREFLNEKKLFKQHYGAHGKLGISYLADPVLNLLGIRRKVYKNGYTLKEQLKYFTTTKLGELLRYADRNSMAHSIEVRLPFLSHKLVEFVFSIPDRLIYRDGKTKFILREGMKSVLPETVYNRTDKIGFAPPQEAWMESVVFQRACEGSEKWLSKAGLSPGPDKFRNLATSTLIKVFSQ